jgi:hypothetical protein
MMAAQVLQTAAPQHVVYNGSTAALGLRTAALCFAMTASRSFVTAAPQHVVLRRQHRFCKPQHRSTLF